MIYLVRHGDTAATARRVFEGAGSGADLGSGLTAEGVRQADAVARALECRGVTRAYTSPLLRTTQTAQIVCSRLGVEPIVFPDLREGSFGLWEGLTFDEIQSGHPEHVKQWFADPVDFSPPGGESVRQMADRAWKCLLSIVTDSTERRGSAVVVTHGGPIRAIIATCLFGGLDAFGAIPQSPGAMNILRYEADSLVVEVVNVRA